MSLIIATGTNLNNKFENLAVAKKVLQEHYNFIAESRVYASNAVDYLDQPPFYNQVLEFKIPKASPFEVMKHLLEIESNLGRIRNTDKGPRIIDLDIIFWGNEIVNSESLSIPHPRWQERSFVALPLQELPYYLSLKDQYNVNTEFTTPAIPI